MDCDSSELVALFLDKANLFFENQQDQQAIHWYNVALTHAPASLEVWKHKALALFHMQSYQQALKAFQQCLKLDRQHCVSYYFVIAQCYYHLDKLSLAFSFYTKLKRKSPNNPQGFIGRGKVFLAQTKNRQAQQQFHKALSYNAHSTRVNYLLANCHFISGNYRKAIPFLNTGIINDRQSVDCYLMKAHCHYNLNEFQKAKICYEQVVQLNQKEQRSGADGLIIAKIRISQEQAKNKAEKELL